MKRYFPSVIAGDYLGDMQTGLADEEFIPGLDVCYFTTYTKFHPERLRAWIYGNLIANTPDWKNAGKKVYVTTEAFGQAIEVNDLDPDLNIMQKVADRHQSQIVMGILEERRVFSYMLINMQRILQAIPDGSPLSRRRTGLALDYER